jgi:hypothetical protein
LLANPVTEKSATQQLIFYHAIAHEIVDAYQGTLQRLSSERAQSVVNRHIGEILEQTAQIHVEGSTLDEVIVSIRKQFKERLSVDVTMSKVTGTLIEAQIRCPFCLEAHRLLRRSVRNCMFALKTVGAFKQKFPKARLAQCELTEDGAKCHIAL